MFKFFLSSSHLRFLTILLILLSYDVESNPGPTSISSNRGSSVTPLSGILSPLVTLSLPIKVSVIMTAFNAGNVNVTFASFLTGVFQFGSSTTSTSSASFDYYILSGNTNINYVMTSNSGSFFISAVFSNDLVLPIGTTNVVVTNSSIQPIPTLPMISNPIPVILTHPSILPVTIENADPIDVAFSTNHPIPIAGSVTLSDPLDTSTNVV